MNKITLVLIGLFVMVSSLVGVTAYVSNNQAFVKAQTIISVDFGNVFPGTSATESFTIDNLIDMDTTSYRIEMVKPDGTGVVDIRPYVMIWKDTVEKDTEPNMIIDGQEEVYIGFGSFTGPDVDLSDKWFVTFNVPDVTLPSGTVLEYGCKIIISPVVGG